MKLTAIPRITLGLVSVSVGLLLAFDVLLHVFPNAADATREMRARIAGNLAIQAAALVQARDPLAIDRTLQGLRSRDPDIVSIGLRRADGALTSQAGDHARGWAPGAGDDASAASNRIAVGILADERRWGALEIIFRPVERWSLSAWLASGSTRLMMLFTVSASLLFFLYLRRMLQHLDPSDAVPERVRGAFDALSEGVLIVDPREQVLLSNHAFDALGPDAARGALVGRKASELEWLAPENQDASADATPWLTAMKSRQVVRGQPFRILNAGVLGAKVIVNCSPVLDERQGVRGCLVTVDDVTALEQSHEQLLEVLADLATSKEQLEVSNAELEVLASRDVLSGCLNRRAFFAALERRFDNAVAQRQELVCIMADIDHFKAINDRYGHAVGDEAIRVFAGLLGGCVRQDALVGRYGGEEFCVAVAGVGFEGALQIAERMRRCVADESSVGASAGHEIALSASFGVTALSLGARNVAEFVDQADRAMYVAKHSGRNRVISFTGSQAAEHAAAEEALT